MRKNLKDQNTQKTTDFLSVFFNEKLHSAGKPSSFLHCYAELSLNLKFKKKSTEVALYTILQSFEYNSCINNCSIGKCLSHSTRYEVNNENIQR